MNQDLCEFLRANSYPGRGILLGAKGEVSVLAYFIMGRSENSRNRVFSRCEDGIRTEAKEPAKMQDPSLVIYHPVRTLGSDTIVTNGDQTDTVRDYLRAGKSFEEALRTREFEPDYPNCTPRISGLLRANGDYTLSILKAEAGRCRRQFFEYPAADGMGHFLSTYQGDGTPLPSFAGEPLQVTIDETDAETLAQKLWAALNAENRVALFVRCSDRAAGLVHTRVINQYGVGDGETVPCPSGKVGTK